MKKPFAALVLALLLPGCSYAISSSLADRVDRTITFDQLAAEPDVHAGKIFILGGAIVACEPAKPSGTLITVAQKPLDYWGKPISTTRTGGDFLLYSPERLDTLVFALGRELTAAGEAAGSKPASLGGREFADPVLIIREFKLWEKPQRSSRAGQSQWNDPLNQDRTQQRGRPE